MKSKRIKRTVQLTVRNVPAQVKKLLHDRAESDGRSLNAVLVEALSLAAGVQTGEIGYNDLDELAGLWINDPEFDKAISEQHRIDEEIWR